MHNICKYAQLLCLLSVLSLKGYIFKKAFDFTEETLTFSSDIKDSFAIDFIWAKISPHVF